VARPRSGGAAVSSSTAVILASPGTNRDRDVAFALEQVGMRASIVPLAEVTPPAIANAALVVVAGGFSFADALGSGRLFALELEARVGDALRSYVERKRPLLGVCNGFQTLVRTGLLPGALGHNAGGSFTCRWVTLAPDAASTSIWTRGIEMLSCPVAHGEGRYLPAAGAHTALRYVHADGSPANGEFPANPNGSPDDVAGVTDATGLVLGLMPHPENHVLAHQHPRWRRGDTTGSCLELFRNGATYTRQS
jgi:phosphoribosylformylglycinamidine synthase subunit PurQ / glutaminase